MYYRAHVNMHIVLFDSNTSNSSVPHAKKHNYIPACTVSLKKILDTASQFLKKISSIFECNYEKNMKYSVINAQ